MRQTILLEVRATAGEKAQFLAARVPQDRAGYQVIRYNGKNYQLRGGIRTAFSIYLDDPIPTKKEELERFNRYYANDRKAY